MDLRHLRYFLVVGDEEHYGRASERLHVTQSAVSQIIRQLESELGVLLFDRAGRGVRLTEAGRMFHRSVATLLRDLQVSVELVQRAARGEAGRLRIGHTGFATWDPVTVQCLSRFRAAYPEVALELREVSTLAQAQALEAGELDAGFQYPSAEQAGLAYLQLRLTERAIAFPADHGLLRQQDISLSDLASEPFVMLAGSMTSHGYGGFTSACLAAGFQPRVVQQADTGATLLQLVGGGMGVTVLTYPQSERLLPHVVIRRVRGLDLPVRLCLAWRDHAQAHPALMKFLDIAHATVEDFGRRGVRKAASHRATHGTD